MIDLTYVYADVDLVDLNSWNKPKSSDTSGFEPRYLK